MPSKIKVLCTIGMRTVLEELAPAFARAKGCTVTRSYDSSVALMQRIAAGETGDAAVFTAAAIDDLIAQGKVSARTDLTRSFVRLSNLPTYPLDRLSRYEATLWRQACQTLFALQILDRRKPWERGRFRVRQQPDYEADS